jgi:transcriptional regulator GlxA family with amidase domain
MRRREVVGGMLMGGGALLAVGRASAEGRAAGPLKAPPAGHINVAVTLSENATVIDFAGPWEVFQDVHVMDRGQDMDAMMPFRLYTVAESTKPITATAGLRILPDHDFKSAPAPHVVVVPAQRGGPALHEWLRQVARTADVVMSVCTGAFHLGRAGLLKGLEATTHHDFFDRFAQAFPDVTLRRGHRFVEGSERIATSGGLTSGVDLALRVVERYFGRQVAQNTADYMEYQSTGWRI